MRGTTGLCAGDFCGEERGVEGRVVGDEKGLCGRLGVVIDEGECLAPDGEKRVDMQGGG